MLQSPLNNVIVTIKAKYAKHMNKIATMAAINPGSQVNPAEFVNILGTIVSIPKGISNRPDYNGFSTKDIKEGDSCVFRYDVIYSCGQNKQGEFVFNNQGWFHGEDYWLCDIQKLFCVIRKNEIIMVNGYCMIEKMSVPSMLVLPQHVKKIIRGGEAILTHIGNNLTHLKQVDCQSGDRVYYDPRIAQSYELGEKKFGIIRQRDILGYKVSNYADLQALNE